MNLKQFDVVLLKDSNKATILSFNTDSYIAEVVDSIGQTIENRKITSNDIIEVLYKRKK